MLGMPNGPLQGLASGKIFVMLFSTLGLILAAIPRPCLTEVCLKAGCWQLIGTSTGCAKRFEGRWFSQPDCSPPCLAGEGVLCDDS